MYAIVEIAGKQFRVSKDMKIKVPRLSSEPGVKIGFDKVMLFEDDKGNTTIGNPLVKNMLVNATVVEHGRERKVIVFKKKRRKGFQKTQGHRQGYSLIEINTIGSGTLKKEIPATKTKSETVKAASKVSAKTTAKEKPKTAAKPATKKAATKSTATKAKTAAAKSTGTKPTAAKTATKKPATKKSTKEE